MKNDVNRTYPNLCYQILQETLKVVKYLHALIVGSSGEIMIITLSL